jgi:hypothetical protein
MGRPAASAVLAIAFAPSGWRAFGARWWNTVEQRPSIEAGGGAQPISIAVDEPARAGLPIWVHADLKDRVTARHPSTPICGTSDPTAWN